MNQEKDTLASAVVTHMMQHDLFSQWLGIEVQGQGWRIGKLADLALYAGDEHNLTALVARDARLLRLPLTLPADVTTWRLAVRDATQLRTWLAAPH